jgi:hypothetical protein
MQRTARGWIVSPSFDLLLLIFAPLLTAPILAGLYFGNRLLVVGGSLTLAFAHYLSSFAFYFWDENRAYYRARWLAFFAGPLILASTYALLILSHLQVFIAVVLFFWNAFHVARQNCGILSIYRNRGGDRAMAHKTIANRAVIATSLYLAVWNIETHHEVAAMFGPLFAHFGSLLRYSTGAVAAAAVAHLAWSIWSRHASGEGPGIAESLFLATSLFFFFPFLLIRTSEIATLTILLPHYVQYMAIVWLVHRRKFGHAGVAAEGVGTVLRKLSGSLWWLLPALAVAGFSFYLILEYSLAVGKQSFALTLFILIAFEHFYLDGLIWSFKQPHVRRTIGPALLG